MKQGRPTGWHPGRRASDPARLLVFDVLMDVAERGAYANLALPEALRHSGLRRLDRAFATNLCYGTLRLQGRWDAIISRVAHGRSASEIDLPLLTLLRMGCHQLLAMDSPAYAVLDETVTIARNELGQGSGGFVNAILRRVAEKADQWRTVIEESTASQEEFLSLWYSHPRWLVHEFQRTCAYYGRGNVEEILDADNEPADVALVARGISTSELAERIVKAHFTSRPGTMMADALLLDSGDPHQIYPVRDGLAGVQDEGSQLISHVCASAPISSHTGLWLDLCAGPGGKTATMAPLAQRAGARIHANEPHEHRVHLVERAVDPWADVVDLRQGDGRDVGTQEPDSYDRVLVDAPCSNSGAIRRRPEARWNHVGSDLEQLTRLQAELLESGYRALAPGGVLVYSTCSPLLSETVDIVEGLVNTHPEAQVLDTAQVASQCALHPISGRNGYVQLFTDTDNTDSMFFACLTKRIEA
ncbi:MAG: transcription antitermination factor NusB [Actinomycetaceae bacterium]|nr:transcription antitermination factor NusB [Actinomycetaceae bacterium]MDY6083172.1 transcription antitermination factor NusB [Actinomycetaceae bacterium]